MDSIERPVALQAGLLVPFRLRMVRVGIASTVVVLPAILAVSLAPGHRPLHMAGFIAVVAVAAVGVVLVAALPWARLFASRLGLATMYVWSVADILLITFAIANTGGGDSELFPLYALTTLFLISYPPRGQYLLVALTLASYTAVVGATGWEPGVAVFLVKFAMLAVLAQMAIFMSRELQLQMTGHATASVESDARAAQLATVAGAARSMSSLDPADVHDAVVEAMNDLGFEAAGVAVFSDDGKTFSIARGRGLPPGFADLAHSADVGMPALVRTERGSVIQDDYPTLKLANLDLVATGIQATVGSPVWLGGAIAAVLVGGTRTRRAISSRDVHAFELLAAQTGIALDNARRYRHERQTVERLAEVDRLKSEFLSMVSHELRTPLTVIIGMGSTLERRWDDLDDETRRDLLVRLNASSKALDEQIATVLDFSAFQTAIPDFKIRALDLGVLAEEVGGQLKDVFRAHTLRIQVMDPLPVRGDTVLLERALESLLSNSAKHTPAGTTVDLVARREDGQAIIRVTDDGPGISLEDSPRLGQRFFRGGDPNHRSTKGLGLGLALVQETLELHGTELHVESGPGAGATFWFALPIFPPATEEGHPDAL